MDLDKLINSIPNLSYFPVWLKFVCGLWVILTAVALVGLLFGRGSLCESDKEIKANIVQYFKNPLLVTNKPSDQFPWIVRFNAESVVDEERLRVFVDYKFFPVGDSSWSEVYRYPVADLKDVYKGQRLDFVVLFRNKFKGSFQGRDYFGMDFRWGSGVPEDHSSFMVDFDYRSRLVFVNHKGNEQYYCFKIIPQGLDGEPKVIRNDEIGNCTEL